MKVGYHHHYCCYFHCYHYHYLNKVKLTSVLAAWYKLLLFQADEFPGLIPLINSYLSGMDVDADTHCTIQQYLKLIQRRASGDLQTTASWLRQFVQSHPDYKLAHYILYYVRCNLVKSLFHMHE